MVATHARICQSAVHTGNTILRLLASVVLCLVVSSPAKADPIASLYATAFQTLAEIDWLQKGVEKAADFGVGKLVELIKSETSHDELAALILQSRDHIINELYAMRDHSLEWKTQGYIDSYAEVLDQPDTQLENWLVSVAAMMGEMNGAVKEGRCEAPSFLAVAEAYNLLVPLRAILMTLNNAGDDVILGMLVRAHQLNEIILGPIHTKGLLAIPSYVESKSKIEPSWPTYCKVGPTVGSLNAIGTLSSRDMPRYYQVMNRIWKANEGIRKAIARYNGRTYALHKQWYRIKNEDGTCLYASGEEPDIVETRGCATGDNMLWRFDFDSYDAARIVHRSGLCLGVQLWDSVVRLFPCPTSFSSENSWIRAFWHVTGASGGGFTAELTGDDRAGPRMISYQNRAQFTGGAWSSPPITKQRWHAELAGFQEPEVEGYRLDWCERWGSNCGKGAAEAFCREHGYSSAARWEIDANVGYQTPTRVIATDEICDKSDCDGFRYIECKGVFDGNFVWSSKGGSSRGFLRR